MRIVSECSYSLGLIAFHVSHCSTCYMLLQLHVILRILQYSPNGDSAKETFHNLSIVKFHILSEPIFACIVGTILHCTYSALSDFP